MKKAFDQSMVNKITQCLTIIDDKYFSEEEEKIQLIFFKSKQQLLGNLVKQSGNMINIGKNGDFINRVLSNKVKIVNNYDKNYVIVFLFHYQNDYNDYLNIILHLTMELLLFKEYRDNPDLRKHVKGNELDNRGIGKELLDKNFELASKYLHDNLDTINDILFGKGEK